MRLFSTAGIVSRLVRTPYRNVRYASPPAGQFAPHQASGCLGAVDAEWNLFDVELSYECSRSVVLQTLIEVCKALQEGWVVTFDILNSAVIN